MRRFAVAALVCATISLGFFSVSAKAGDYYDGGYRHGYSSNVWYSSSCCYRKVVRHERRVRYVRTDDGYYDRPYRRSYYSDGYAPRRYVNSGYYGNDYYNNGYNDRYYNDGYSSYAQSCTWHRDRLYDGRGGWVWGERRRVCY